MQIGSNRLLNEPQRKVLTYIARNPGQLAYDMKRSGLRVSPNDLYPALRGLVEKGLIIYQKDGVTRAGLPKKRYSATISGVIIVICDIDENLDFTSRADCIRDLLYRGRDQFQETCAILEKLQGEKELLFLFGVSDAALSIFGDAIDIGRKAVLAYLGRRGSSDPLDSVGDIASFSFILSMNYLNRLTEKGFLLAIAKSMIVFALAYGDELHHMRQKDEETVLKEFGTVKDVFIREMKLESIRRSALSIAKILEPYCEQVIRDRLNEAARNQERYLKLEQEIKKI